MTTQRRFWGFLRVQVLLLMLVLLLLPLGGVGWYYYATLSTDLKEIEKAHALEVSASAHRLLDQLGEHLASSTITNAKWLDNWEAVQARDIGWIEENVNVSLGIIPDLSFIATVDNDGNVLSQAGDIPEFTGKLADLSILEKTAATPDIHGMIQTSKGLAVMAASQITDEKSENPSAGLLIFGRLLDDDAMAGIGTILNAGLALKSAEGQKLGSDQETAGLLADGAAPLPALGAEPAFGSGHRKGTRASEVASAHPGISGEAVALMQVSVPAEASGTVQREMIRLSGIAAVMAIGLIVLIAVILQKRIVVPLVRFDTYLRDVSAGHLSGELSDRECSRADEIGSIANALREMSGQLRGLVSGIRSTATVAAEAAGRLTEDAGQAAENAESIAEAMREVAAGADSQREGMKRGAEVTHELLGSMMTIGERTTSVAAAAEQATKHAGEGNDTVMQAIRQMQVIASAVEQSVRDARLLHEKSGQIGAMADAISAIAYRTNILALNANIEASRAGEQGRGFAVVAGEVRKLAMQANGTAAEIAHRVDEIRAGIAEVTNRIEAGYKEVESGTDFVSEAGVAFEGITSGISDMEGELREIAAAGQIINARIEELSALVGQTEAISETSADKSQEAAGFAESQMNAVQRVAEAMGVLSGRIRDLERAANRFK